MLDTMNKEVENEPDIEDLKSDMTNYLQKTKVLLNYFLTTLDVGELAKLQNRVLADKNILTEVATKLLNTHKALTETKTASNDTSTHISSELGKLKL